LYKTPITTKKEEEGGNRLFREDRNIPGRLAHHELSYSMSCECMVGYLGSPVC